MTTYQHILLKAVEDIAFETYDKIFIHISAHYGRKAPNDPAPAMGTKVREFGPRRSAAVTSGPRNSNLALKTPAHTTHMFRGDATDAHCFPVRVLD